MPSDLEFNSYMKKSDEQMKKQKEKKDDTNQSSDNDAITSTTEGSSQPAQGSGNIRALGASPFGALGIASEATGVGKEALEGIGFQTFGLAGMATQFFAPGGANEEKDLIPGESIENADNDLVSNSNETSTISSTVDAGASVALNTSNFNTSNSPVKGKSKKNIEQVAIKLKSNVDRLQDIMNDHSFSLDSVKSKCNFKYLNKATIKCEFFPADGQIKAMEFMVLQKASLPCILYPSQYHGYEEAKTSNFNQTESAQFLEKKAEKIEKRIKKVEEIIKNSTQELSSAGKSLMKASEELQELNIIGVTLKEELAKVGEQLSSIN